MRTRKLVASLATVTMLSMFAGCGGDEPDTEAGDDPTPSAPTSSAPPTESSPPVSEAPPAQSVKITIKGFEHSDPGPVAPGTEITVENLDDVAHTVTADGKGDFDVTIKPGETATLTAPSEPGEYPFVCTFHSGMTGTLVVA